MPEPATAEVSRSEKPTTSIKNRLRPRVWYLVPARFLCVLIPLVGFVIAIPGSEGTGAVASAFNYTGGALIAVGLVLYLLSLAAVAGVWMDRKRLDADGEWYPSRWCYLLLYPGFILQVPLSTLYTYRRLKYVGARSQR